MPELLLRDLDEKSMRLSSAERCSAVVNLCSKSAMEFCELHQQCSADFPLHDHQLPTDHAAITAPPGAGCTPDQQPFCLLQRCCISKGQESQQVLQHKQDIDGSKDSSRTGSTFVTAGSRYSFRFPNDSSMYSAELTATENALLLCGLELRESICAVHESLSSSVTPRYLVFVMSSSPGSLPKTHLNTCKNLKEEIEELKKETIAQENERQKLMNLIANIKESITANKQDGVTNDEELSLLMQKLAILRQEIEHKIEDILHDVKSFRLGILYYNKFLQCNVISVGKNELLFTFNTSAKSASDAHHFIRFTTQDGLTFQ
ncbi:hypothetical protein J6590_076198, partial [Homalodisca vitripennis]